MEVKIIEKPRVGIYNRTRPGEDLAEEIKKENKVVSKYIENNDVELVGIYRDINCHTVEERPEYNRMIKDIFERKVDKIAVVEYQSKLTRNLDIQMKIRKAVEIVEINENGKEQNRLGKTIGDIGPILALVNQYYREDLSRRIKQGIKLSKEKKKASK